MTASTRSSDTDNASNPEPDTTTETQAESQADNQSQDLPESQADGAEAPTDTKASPEDGQEDGPEDSSIGATNVSTDSNADHSDPPESDDPPEDLEGTGASSESSDGSSAEPAKKTRRSTTKKKPERKPKSETKPETKSETKPEAQAESKTATKATHADPISKRMLINYVPGEECRVAILEDYPKQSGVLGEYHAERPATANRVGNLYLAKVTNVESNLQAAFVDFGGGENAFLHTSDLHPRYFPSEDGETTEKIGKKTPRRERPPIQRCLKRGQKIIVQILKDGVGTKGPACTSYLSIPGRYLVMMPHMDNVGVSRKVDDEDMRKKMRKILDQLDLPEGFGFILRTAGFDKTKTELKRDLAYLQRLWKNIEKRQKQISRPALLYAESDLLVRALRDLLSKEIQEIVIDSEQGLARAANFLKVVAPRSGTTLKHYNLPQPMFHAYGLEDQVKLLHSREVPLPSGGRLVIDETEALVAIDVNSGKSRKAKDAETNAYQTNLEAVDEICRQMKLRELGGLVINDLIDMNQAKHRKAVEQRFKDCLKNDRANTTILPISEFGILELTRQRMRASATMTHFQELPAAYGRGWVRKADSVAAEAMRELRLILSYDKVKKAELIVPARVAGNLLSTRRKALTRLEIATEKHIDVRIGDSLGTDRFMIYAYDEVGNDVATDRLPKPKPPKSLPTWDVEHDESAFADDEKSMLEAIQEDEQSHPIEQLAADTDDEPADTSGKKKRRRRRKKKIDSDEATEGTATESTTNDEEAEPTGESAEDESRDEAGGKKKRRRRRRRRRGSGEDADAGGEAGTETGATEPADASQDEPAGDASKSETDDGAMTTKKKRRRRRRGGRSTSDAEAASATTAVEPKPAEAKGEQTPAKKKPRTLYAGSRRKLKPSEKAALGEE
ncbi:MAG: Rne/Rng family ribonuclease [Planctomycetota bacterium]